jgi:hypothetical protein
VFGTVPGKVAVGLVADPLRRGRIQVDVGVFAPDEPRPAPRAISRRTREGQGHESPCHLECLHRPANC